MKKILSFFLVISILFSLSSTSYASNSYAIELNEIANKTIYLTQEVQDSDARVTTYNNISSFFEMAHSLYPNLSDEQFASFVIEYIGQDSSALSEEDLHNVLQYESISTSSSFFKITQDGEFQELSEEEMLMPLDIFTSTDGYMQLDTSYSLKKTVGSNKYFSVWTYATWIKWPAVALNDVLVLSTTGTFDSSVNEIAYVSQIFKCNGLSNCPQNTTRYRNVSKNKPVMDDLTLKYSNFTPYISFTPISPRCDYCTGGMGQAKDVYFKAYLSYGIITSNTCNIQAHYGHTTVGITNIQVSIKDGAVNITPGLAAIVQTYIARAVTVK